MSLNDELKDTEGRVDESVKRASDAGEKAAKKVADAANEVRHHAQAEGEREKRELLDDRLSVGAKVKSVAEEAKHRVQENVSGMKRKLDNL